MLFFQRGRTDSSDSAIWRFMMLLILRPGRVWLS